LAFKNYIALFVEDEKLRIMKEREQARERLKASASAAESKGSLISIEETEGMKSKREANDENPQKMRERALAKVMANPPHKLLDVCIDMFLEARL
jgi:hypothetical protein